MFILELKSFATFLEKNQIVFIFQKYFNLLSQLEFNKSLKVSYLKALESAFLVLLQNFSEFQNLYLEIIFTCIFFN